MILASKNLIYKAVYHGARSLIEVFAALEVEGWETIPEGACLFASNHQSMVDPPLIGSCLPREISFVARRTLFDNPAFGFVIRACNSIPLDRGQADVGAIRSALAALAAGRGLLIFPEGTRSADGVIAEAKAGAGLLACRSGAPTTPHSNQEIRCGITTQRKSSLRPRMTPGDMSSLNSKSISSSVTLRSGSMTY